jgi:hypothetical protein
MAPIQMPFTANPKTIPAKGNAPANALAALDTRKCLQSLLSQFGGVSMTDFPVRFPPVWTVVLVVAIAP